MNITITVPVHIDEPVTAAARRKLKAYLEASLVTAQDDIRRSNMTTLFDPKPRMLGTVCRFKFGEVKAKVE